MNILWQILFVIFWILRFLLIARLVLEWVRFFARSWMPVGRAAVAVESVYTVTDPPVRLVSRIIPVVRLGGMAIDIGLMLLLVLLSWVILPILLDLAVRSA